MPTIMIETRKGWISDSAAVIAAVCSATHIALNLPDWDRIARLIEHDPDHFTTPPNKGDRFILITVTHLTSCSQRAKSLLYAGIIDSLAALGVPATDVIICMNDVRLDDLALFGARSASEIESDRIRADWDREREFGAVPRYS